MTFSSSEEQFLQQHNLSPSMFWDAGGRPIKYSAQAMSSHGFDFAYNCVPCKNAGHRLRTRANHCIQCYPARIAFIMRHTSKGFVYIAFSESTALVKVGCTSNISHRQSTLNSLAYGRTNDWTIVASKPSQRMGEDETAIHRILTQYRIHGTYIRDGVSQFCNELYLCNLNTAIGALKHNQPKYPGYSPKWTHPSRTIKSAHRSSEGGSHTHNDTVSIENPTRRFVEKVLLFIAAPFITVMIINAILVAGAILMLFLSLLV
jgi:hypothetical protein